MQAKNSSEELLRRLSTSVAPVEDVALAAARRQHVVAHLADLVATLPARRQRRRRFVWAATVSSAAALALTVGFVATWHHRQAKAESQAGLSAVVALEGSVQIIHRAAEVVAPPLAPIRVGSADEVVTGKGGRARASLASGVEIDIDPESRMRVRAEESVPAPGGGNEAVVLGKGRVAVRVPKLGRARTFAVETPEATIVVHGTAFSVERSAGPSEAPRTSVDVSEGIVAVRCSDVEILLHAGDHWSSASPAQSRGAELEAPKFVSPRSTLEVAPSKPRSTTSAPRARSNASSGRGSPDSSSDKNSSLAAENRLLQAAMAARQQGDPRRAAELAGELVTRYPASPLVEEARVERMRALVGAGGAAAAEAEARSYLGEYPQGFARQEASRILGNVSP